MWKSSKYYNGKIRLYEHKNGDITYYVRYHHDGKTKTKKVGTKSNGWNEKKAYNERKKLIDKSKNGSYDMSVDDLANEYFEFAKLHRKSYENTKLSYDKHIKKEFGDKKPNKLSDKDVIRFQTSLKEKNLSESTINVYLGILTQIINHGVKNHLIEYSPFKNTKRLSVDNMRNRYLTHDEIDVLLKNSEHDEDVFLFVLLSVFLGGRANTILNIKRRNIDFYNKKVLLRDFKRNKDYTIPLHPVLYKTLKDKYKDNIYVIGNTNKISYHQMYLKLSPILDDLFNKDIDKKDRKNRVVIHTLRHTFASQLAMSGVSLAYIKNFMHHSNIKMSEKYIHLAPELSNEQIEKLDFKAF